MAGVEFDHEIVMINAVDDAENVAGLIKGKARLKFPDNANAGIRRFFRHFFPGAYDALQGSFVIDLWTILRRLFAGNFAENSRRLGGINAEDGRADLRAELESSPEGGHVRLVIG